MKKPKLPSYETVWQWFLYFAVMGWILSAIVFVLSIIHGEPPLYIHGVVVLEAFVFATLSTLVKQGKLFKKKNSVLTQITGEDKDR